MGCRSSKQPRVTRIRSHDVDDTQHDDSMFDLSNHTGECKLQMEQLWSIFGQSMSPSDVEAEVPEHKLTPHVY